MTQTKHTPGPWQKRGVLTSDNEMTFGGWYVVLDKVGNMIGLFENKEDRDTAAAAPDLLNFAVNVESVGEDQLQAMDLAFARDYIRTLKALAGAAIAKATGEA